MANSFYFDASALAKRYVPENGSTQIHSILNAIAAQRIYLLNIGTGEVVSMLVRKRNAGIISTAYFVQASLEFQNEIISAPGITRIPVTSRLVTGSIPLIVAHSINSTDAWCSNRRWPSLDDYVAPETTWSWSLPISACSTRLARKG